MRIAIVYYSRTGHTEFVINALKNALMSSGLSVDTYSIKPVREYGKPLHLNPRTLYDTLIRKSTSIKIEPSFFNTSEYSLVVVASPIWFMNIAPPVQEFLKKQKLDKPVVLLTTSSLRLNCDKLLKTISKKHSFKPTHCFNISKSDIEERSRLDSSIVNILDKLKNIVYRTRV